MHLNGESSQCDEMKIKTSHIFQILLKFFHLQSYVSTTRMTKMSEKLLPQQGGDISISPTLLAHFTPYKGVALNQYATSSCQICREALNNRMIILKQTGKFKFFIRAHAKWREFEKVFAELGGGII